MTTIQKLTVGVVLLSAAIPTALRAQQSTSTGFEHCTLGVPCIAQQGSLLCWAACTEMVMRHDSTLDSNAVVWSQCELAKQNFLYDNIGLPIAQRADSITCPCDTFTRLFDSSGIPFLYQTGMLPYYRVQSFGSMGWDSLCSYIDRKIPVIFQWNALGFDTSKHSAQHVMVAEGYSRSMHLGTSRWISVNDPEPPLPHDPRGHHRQIAYNEFNYTSRGFTPWSRSAQMSSKGSVWIATGP